MPQSLDQLVDLSISPRFDTTLYVGHPTADFRFDHQLEISLHVGQVPIEASVLIGKTQNQRANVVHLATKQSLFVQNTLKLLGDELQVDGIFAHRLNIVLAPPNAHTGNVGQS